MGEVKSRGLELDLAGEILPGWKVIASGYLNDAFVSQILPSYVRFDAALFYKWNSGRIALNLKNLGNLKYYESNDFLVFPQAPFTVQGKVSVNF